MKPKKPKKTKDEKVVYYKCFSCQTTSTLSFKAKKNLELKCPVCGATPSRGGGRYWTEGNKEGEE